MDFELEMLCARNAERRRWAEEEDQKQRRLEEQARREEQVKKWSRWGRWMKVLGLVHLAVSAVLVMLRLPVWAFMGFAGAVFFYLVRVMCKGQEEIYGEYGSV